MAYNAHNWSVGEAITKDKMNAIEGALASTSTLAENTNNTISSIDTKVNEAKAEVNRLGDKVTNIENTA